jgi:transposase InsO family protein
MSGSDTVSRNRADTIKIAPGLYQYTAIDDCTLVMVLGLYPRRTAANAVDFLDYVLGQVRFPIQRIQTDRGKEFTSYKFQEKLAEYRIKWRPTRPRSPHLNGKVERVQKTCLDELYATLDLDALEEEELLDELEAWQDHFNWNRVHGTLGQAPMEKLLDLWDRIPDWEEVVADYDPRAEHWRSQMLALEKYVS